MRVFVNENEKKETFPAEPITGLELIPLRLFRFIPAYIYNIFIIVAYIYIAYTHAVNVVELQKNIIVPII